jgi:hypothetical protein
MLRVKEGSNNYGAWAFKARHRLGLMDLWDYVGGSKTTTPIVPLLVQPSNIHGLDPDGVITTIVMPGNQNEHNNAKALAEPWIKKDEQAFDLILGAVPDDLLHIVKRCKTSQQAWNCLRTSLQPANSIRALAIKQRIISYNCESTFNVLTWLNDCELQYDELCNMDPNMMSDIEFSQIILGNMPLDSSWRNFMSGLRQEYSRRPEHPGSIEVINSIRDEYWAQHKDDPETYSKVFTAKFKARKRPVDTNEKDTEYSESKRQQRTQLEPWRDKSKLRCTVKDCESPMRHEAGECFAYGGGKQGQYPVWYRGPRDIHLPKSKREPRKTRPRVFHANDGNHPIGSDSSTHHQDSESPSTFIPPTTSVDGGNNFLTESNRVWMAQIEPGVLDNEKAEIISCALPITDARKMPKSTDCYHDSGTNRHIFNKRDMFSDYTEIAPVKVQGFSEGLTVAAVGKGTVKLEGSYKGMANTFTLSNCLHVPGAHANLISQIRLDKYGVATYFNSGYVTLFKNGIPCIDGTIHNEMYRLNMKPTKNDDTDHTIAMMSQITDEPDFCIA